MDAKIVLFWDCEMIRYHDNIIVRPSHILYFHTLITRDLPYNILDFCFLGTNDPKTNLYNYKSTTISFGNVYLTLLVNSFFNPLHSTKCILTTPTGIFARTKTGILFLSLVTQKFTSSSFLK